VTDRSVNSYLIVLDSLPCCNQCCITNRIIFRIEDQIFCLCNQGRNRFALDLFGFTDSATEYVLNPRYVEFGLLQVRLKGLLQLLVRSPVNNCGQSSRDLNLRGQNGAELVDIEFAEVFQLFPQSNLPQRSGRCGNRDVRLRRWLSRCLQRRGIDLFCNRIEFLVRLFFFTQSFFKQRCNFVLPKETSVLPG